MAMPALQELQDTPPTPMDGPVVDRRALFRRLTRLAQPDPSSEQAFLASKLEILRSDSAVCQTERDEAQGILGLAPAGVASGGVASGGALEPVPHTALGGVGFGTFYANDFRAGFVRGTSCYYEIVSPQTPGGNVTGHLYLTASNRARKGVEAFVSYDGQDDTRFKIFDWARSDPWQSNVRFDDLAPYLRGTVSHSWGLQVLPVMNTTVEIGSDRWRNEVLLHNRSANRWDLIYRYDYPSDSVEQTRGWIGSWGPLVHALQASYYKTRWLGFLNTMLIERNAAGNWGNWNLLTTGQSAVRNDGHGFSPLFLDPNCAFVLKS